jgi:hypothetical protein
MRDSSAARSDDCASLDKRPSKSASRRSTMPKYNKIIVAVITVNTAHSAALACGPVNILTTIQRTVKKKKKRSIKKI